MSLKTILKWAPCAENVWHSLHGFFAVYKPPREHICQTLHTLKVHICRDMNKLEVRPPAEHLWITGDTTKPMTIEVGPSWADNVLLTGPRYQFKDVQLVTANSLYTDSSGILVVAIGNKKRIAQQMRRYQPPKFYRIKGILGKATDNFFITGKTMEKSSFKHVHRNHIDMICAAMQSSHQKKMFELCGVPIQSQAAYEMAVQGPIRPADPKITMVYSIKCLEYKAPEFTLEVICTNEDEMYLKGLVHELGRQVRSTAACSQIQCVSFGAFNLEHALLKKHWNLEAIARNMAVCKQILKENKNMEEPATPILREYSNVQQLTSSDKPLIEA